jgi:hypothetical protein
MTLPHTLKDEMTVKRLYPTSPYVAMTCTQSNCGHEFMLVLPDDKEGIAEVEKNLRVYNRPWNPIYGFECPYCHFVYGKLQSRA